MKAVGVPNDLARAKDGRVFLSGQDWGTSKGAIFFCAKGSTTAVLLEDGMGRTNGIALSPDDKVDVVMSSEGGHSGGDSVCGGGGGKGSFELAANTHRPCSPPLALFPFFSPLPPLPPLRIQILYVTEAIGSPVASDTTAAKQVIWQYDVDVAGLSGKKLFFDFATDTASPEASIDSVRSTLGERVWIARLCVCVCACVCLYAIQKVR